MNTTAKLPKISVLLLGAGRGERMGGGSKAFAEIQGITLFERAVANFKPFADEMLIGVQKKDLVRAKNSINDLDIQVVVGGQSRLDTLKALADRAHNKRVLIHDVARPFIQRKLIEKLLKASHNHPAVALCTPFHSYDALVLAKYNTVIDTVPGRYLFRVQTPVICARDKLLTALENADPENPQYSSVIGILFKSGCKVHLIEGSEDNIKITYPEDLEEAERIACKYTGLT